MLCAPARQGYLTYTHLKLVSIPLWRLRQDGDQHAWADSGALLVVTRWYSNNWNLGGCNLQFIADIRGARVHDLEEKRINKEMANIRKKFKGS